MYTALKTQKVLIQPSNVAVANSCKIAASILTSSIDFGSESGGNTLAKRNNPPKDSPKSPIKTVIRGKKPSCKLVHGNEEGEVEGEIETEAVISTPPLFSSIS